MLRVCSMVMLQYLIDLTLYRLVYRETHMA
nr:MAG TPA_asm: hypothetical protein [Bacteriophage sp.]DAT27273.1 MAG TPA: hypothetical protein [Caudoviricetes sp.]